MDAVTTIAVIRDLLFIVGAVIGIILLVVGSVLMWRIYRSLKRTTNNLEQASDIVLGFVSNPLVQFGGLGEIVRRVVGWIPSQMDLLAEVEYP